MPFDLIILAAIAVFVLMRLFSVLGQQKGAPPPVFRDDRPEEPRRPVQVVRTDNQPDDEEEEEEILGLAKIQQRDPSFSKTEFDSGAKAAYEMIVKAFADGDRDTLRSLLTRDVYEDYDAALRDRENSGSEPLELMRVKEHDMEAASLIDSVAEITMKFVAELSDGDRIINTRELWTFERDLNDRDPNWRLSDVSAA